jgi:hypothetical protein
MRRCTHRLTALTTTVFSTNDPLICTGDALAGTGQYRMPTRFSPGFLGISPVGRHVKKPVKAATSKHFILFFRALT